MIEIDSQLKNQYDTQYSNKSEEWRRIGATGKVANIMELTKGLDFKTVVDIGAGDGNILSMLSEQNFCNDFTAVEISNSAIEQIKKKNIKGLTQIKQFDGYTLPFKDKEFDLAICSHVIEHVEFPRMLLREIKRVSKYQVLEVPIDFSFSIDKNFKHFYAYGHINIYTPSIFNFLLLTEKFEILKSKGNLYRKEVAAFQFGKYSISYLKVLIKRMVWKMFPVLMKIKPNTYTVLLK